MEEIRKTRGNGKYLIFCLVILLSVALGAVGMYFYIKAIPGTTIINKQEKEVTVTDSGIADAVEKVYDSVVIVEVYKNDTLYGTGSGFIYKKDNNKYYVMTNNHVVSGANTVKIVLSDDSTITTEVVGSDKYIDIAVLKFESDKDLNVAEIGSSESARVGDTTFTVGAPIDSNTYSWTVTRGILSGKDRMVSVSTSNSSAADYVMKSLQTDADINSGNSGGPLCNSNGQVIGITNMKLVSSSIEGMSFAIPIETAMEYASKLISGEDVSHPSIGISMADLSQASTLYLRYNISIPSSVEKGVVVVSVLDGKPAKEAGLKQGDIITHVDGVEVSSMAKLKYELYQHKVGEKVKVKYIRNGNERETEITLAKSEE